MTHYRNLYEESQYLGAQDVQKPREVTIHSVERVKIVRKKKTDEPDEFRPHLYVATKEGERYPRAYLFPKSVGQLLANRYGSNIDDWAGKKITLFATKCFSFGAIEECVRIEGTDKEHAKIRTWLKKRGSNPDSYIKQ